MGLTVTRTDLDAIDEEWRCLLDDCTNNHVFLSPTWLRAWWAEFGGPSELVLLAVRDVESLVGIVPFVRRGEVLTFAGNTKVCDYMDFPCLDGRQQELLSALFRSLGEEPWATIELWALPEQSATLAALPAVCRELGLAFAKEAEDVCPQLALPYDWETYLASLGKKDRHELRRKLRKLPQAGDVELEVLSTPSELGPSLDDFLRMHRESRSDKAAFMSDQMERFFRTVVLALAAEGRVEMIFLRLAGKRTAALLSFVGRGETLLYNSGYDPEYSQFSVGLLSKALSLQRAIEQGQNRFDFLRGHERYKYELGAQDVPVYRVSVGRAT